MIKLATKTGLSCYIPCQEKDLVFYQIFRSSLCIESAKVSNPLCYRVLIKKVATMRIHLEIAREKRF